MMRGAYNVKSVDCLDTPRIWTSVDTAFALHISLPLGAVFIQQIVRDCTSSFTLTVSQSQFLFPSLATLLC